MDHIADVRINPSRYLKLSSGEIICEVFQLEGLYTDGYSLYRYVRKTYRVHQWPWTVMKKT